MLAGPNGAGKSTFYELMIKPRVAAAFSVAARTHARNRWNRGRPRVTKAA